MSSCSSQCPASSLLGRHPGLELAPQLGRPVQIRDGVRLSDPPVSSAIDNDHPSIPLCVSPWNLEVSGRCGPDITSRHHWRPRCRAPCGIGGERFFRISRHLHRRLMRCRFRVASLISRASADRGLTFEDVICIVSRFVTSRTRLINSVFMARGGPCSLPCETSRVS
jgi:hypothetical protein